MDKNSRQFNHSKMPLRNYTMLQGWKVGTSKQRKNYHEGGVRGVVNLPLADSESLSLLKQAGESNFKPYPLFSKSRCRGSVPNEWPMA